MSFEVLTYGFMQRAILTGAIIAILSSVIGLFLVLRRYSLFGDAFALSLHLVELLLAYLQEFIHYGQPMVYQYLVH
ncbi:MAG: hypothetical protein CM1200mP11_1120 [Nitrosopumilaceae archaeon]|nr:MAG: hypothetical protein CM1200mP11_1120 [Nitrosopumilaceae archaeon]